MNNMYVYKAIALCALFTTTMVNANVFQVTSSQYAQSRMLETIATHFSDDQAVKFAFVIGRLSHNDKKLLMQFVEMQALKTTNEDELRRLKSLAANIVNCYKLSNEYKRKSQGFLMSSALLGAVAVGCWVRSRNRDGIASPGTMLDIARHSSNASIVSLGLAGAYAIPNLIVPPAIPPVLRF